MAKGSGGIRLTSPYSSTKNGTLVNPIGINSNGNKIKINVVDIDSVSTSINDMQNRDMQKELNRAISRYESVLGLRERNIKLAPLNGSYGVTYFDENGSQGIYLNSKLFDVPKKQFEQEYKNSNYARRGGFKNVTRTPAQHTITHELAHSTWTSGYISQKAQNAGREIKDLYKSFIKDTSTVRRKNYGSYGSKNVDEFWAETITKAIHGDSDKYTKRAIAIAKKYKL